MRHLPVQMLVKNENERHRLLSADKNAEAGPLKKRKQRIMKKNLTYKKGYDIFT